MTESSLQYPVGRFAAPDVVTPALRDAAIAGIGGAPAAMRAAVAGLTESQLATPYRDGGWTVRQVVHHVADSHMHAYIRVKFAFTEQAPTIRPYDEAAWAVLPDVASVPIDVSLGLIDGIHQRWVACVRGLDAAMLQRTFVHPEMGPQPVDLSLLRYDWHGRHHIAHITSLRSRMGW